MEQVVAQEKVVEKKGFKPWLVYVICFAISLVFMFFFGINSPIHTFNGHSDFNWYVTMGRGFVAGKVPYRDLFDHKGPITYFVFAFATLFPSYQIAVWCLEVICISLYLYFCYRIARKFLSPWLSLAVVPLMMMILSTNFYRGLNGACVEEFCLPIFAYGLLCFLDFIMDKRPVTWQRSLALGICLGILFWVKFSMWEFFLFPMLIWLIMNLARRDWKTVLRSGLIMLGGLLIVTLPIIIYFGAVGALGDLWQSYFVINLGSYTGDIDGGSAQEKFIRGWKNSLSPILMSPYFILFFVFGIVCFAVQYWRQKSGWLLLIAIIPTYFLIGFICGYFYYYLPLQAYAVLGLIYLVKFITNVIDITIKKQWVNGLILTILTVISFCLALPFASNMVEINQPRESYAPLVVADIIAEHNQTAETPATLFCYYMGDGGFYNAAEIVPNVRYYSQHCFAPQEFPELFASYDVTIREQKCDFVICYVDEFKKNEEFLLTYYQFYFGSLEKSTLPFRFFDATSYGENEIVILFRR